jgi:hypothetical protein
MEIVKIASSAIQDLKEVLEAQKIDSTHLRIVSSAG